MWTELLLIISPPGAASLTTKLNREEDFTPIAKAIIKAPNRTFAKEVNVGTDAS